VDSSVSEIKITAPPENTGDRVRIDGSVVDDSDNYRKTVSLDNGKNEIKIKVTDDKDNQRTYTLNVTRGSSSDNQDKIYLDDLTISEGTLDFSADETSYDVDVDESVSNVTIGATPENEEYLVTMNGKEVKSDDDYEKNISLSKGQNTVNVVVQDEVNDKKRTYTLTINRGTAEDVNQNSNTGTSTNNIENISTSIDKKTGWVQTDAGVYSYLNADGLRVTGWFKDNGKWYLLNTKGVMLTGWYKEETTAQSTTNNSSDTTTTDTSSNTNTTKTENWYYLNADGSMRTGWLLDGEKWYYLNTNGIMQKGWLIISNSKYYLNPDGTMATGTKTIDGKEYKFTTSGALII
jgi:glucan-binding YG repeat protein